MTVAYATSAGTATATTDYTDASGTLSLVAREGKPAPGFGGAVFSDFSPGLFRLAINDAGRVAFTGHVTGAGVYGVPETFVVGRDGTIVYKLVGGVTPQNLDRVLKVEIERALKSGT